MDEFIFTMRVYAEDTDYGGIVYHANHLKYLERARTELLRSLGCEQDKFLVQGYLFVVTELNIKYRRPAKFNDMISIKTRVLKKGRASILFEQVIEKQGNQQTLTTAKVKVVCVNRKLKPCALPNFG